MVECALTSDIIESDYHQDERSLTDISTNPPRVLLIGMNHTTAPVELRECIALSKEDIFAGMCVLRARKTIREVALLSTCNRVEIVVVSESVRDAIEAVKRYISQAKGMPIPAFEKSLYIHEGDEAVRHLFRVASSLDSMILGEPQILGQIKEAYSLATSNKSSGTILNKLFHRAFFVAKKVRSETGIGGHAVSVSYAAVEMGKKIFGSLDDKKVMLIGAGEMAELAVEHLMRNRVGEIVVANRTFERGMELAEKFRGKAIRFEEIADCLQFVDIIISSTGSKDFVISRDTVKPTIRKRKNRPLFFIDIAVPRDIDPEINGLPNCFVYDIDDLNGVIEENIEDRKREAMKGERIVDEAVIRFRQWFEGLDVVPTIIALRNKANAYARIELAKTLKTLSHLSDEDASAIERMASALVNKMLHDPTQFIKLNSCRKDKSMAIDMTRKLFKL